MWAKLAAHEGCTYIDDEKQRCWHYEKDTNLKEDESVYFTCDEGKDDPYGEDENPVFGKSWCWVDEDKSCEPRWDSKDGYKKYFGLFEFWYIDTELKNFEDRGDYNGKVPCPRKTEDGRCWFWVP